MLGLTAVLAGLAVLVFGSRLKYLVPYWQVIFADYGFAIALHLARISQEG